MLKSNELVKDLNTKVLEELRSLLNQVPALELLDIQNMHNDIDLMANLKVFGRERRLVCEVKSSGQPRYVRMGLLQLRNYVAHQNQDAIPVFIAPYLSPEAQSLCREQNVNYLDLQGNARLVFYNIFIERRVDSKPATDRRELRSLFKPKSAQVLRTMLRNPQKEWRVTDLAEEAGVSLGHVSNVRVGLIDRDWAQVSENGLFLSDPDALLDGWRDSYEQPAGKRLKFYTTLHGSTLEEAARKALSSDEKISIAAFASFSAANWLAPYGRTGTQYFYSTELGLERLQSILKLSATTKGENVVITLLKDPDLLRDTVEPAPGAICTSPVQTYLDLTNAGERGQEAAEHLRREMLAWRK